MTWSQIDDAGAADDFWEDKDEGTGGHHQRLRPRASITQRLGDDDGNEEIQRRRQNLRSKSI